MNKLALSSVAKDFGLVIKPGNVNRFVQSAPNCIAIAANLAHHFGCAVPKPTDLHKQISSSMASYRDAVGSLRSSNKNISKDDAIKATTKFFYDNIERKPYSPTGHYLVVRGDYALREKDGRYASHVTFEHKNHGEFNYNTRGSSNKRPILFRIPLEAKTSKSRTLKGCYRCASDHAKIERGNPSKNTHLICKACSEGKGDPHDRREKNLYRAELSRKTNEPK